MLPLDPDPPLKEFLDHQLHLLREPLEIDEPISEILSNQSHDSQISKPQLQDILNRVNKALQTEWDQKYTSQKNNEIVRSIITSEREKFATVDQQIFKAYHQLQSFDLSNLNSLSMGERKEKLRSLRELIEGVPEPKYFNLLETKLLTDYTDLRDKLLTMCGELKYNFDKLEYLQSLNSKLEDTFSSSTSNATGDKDINVSLDNLQDQISKFKLLVELIAYKSSLTDLHNS